MKKLLVIALFTVSAVSLFGQKLNQIKDMVSSGEWAKAKDGIDKYLGNEKNAGESEAWYYKGKIYNSIIRSQDAAIKGLLDEETGRVDAANAFKKYYELDSKNILGTLDQNVWLFDIYNAYFDKAAAGFNEKDYEKALKNFKSAHEIEQYVVSKDFEYNGFKFPAFDTTMYQNLAVAAYQAKKVDEAAGYYEAIADKKITGKSFEEVYMFLVDHYNKKGDTEKTKKYQALGMELYPDNDYWLEVELDGLKEDKPKLFAKYEDLIGKNPTKNLLMYNYAVELFNYIYAGDGKPDDYTKVQDKIEDVLKKALAIKQTPEANMLMARHIYNALYDVQESLRAIKGQTAPEKAKREPLKKQIADKWEQLLPYAKSSYDNYDSMEKLRAIDKANFKMVIDMIIGYYDSKKDFDNSDKYKAKMKTIN